MVVELRQKSQLTIPSEIIKSLNLKIGDQFDIRERNGIIYMVPVVTYPKAYMNKLEKEVRKFESDFANGKLEGFTDVDELINSLNKK